MSDWPRLPGIVQIKDTTLANGTTASVTFSSLGTYNHLQLVIQARTIDLATISTLIMRFNGDSGNNYATQHSWGDTVNPQASLDTGQTGAAVGNIASSGGDSGQAGVTNILILNYRGTTFNKTVLASWGHIANGSNSQTGTSTSRWDNTSAAITSVLVKDAAGANFAIGSRFTLYGLT